MKLTTTGGRVEFAPHLGIELKRPWWHVRPWLVATVIAMVAVAAAVWIVYQESNRLPSGPVKVREQRALVIWQGGSESMVASHWSEEVHHLIGNS